MADLRIPVPVAGDGEDVHWALTTAASLQASGEHQEALRWLRRAVSAAMASSHDGRALELGRMAAELEEALAAASTDRGAHRDTLPEETELTPRAPLPATPRAGGHMIEGLDEVTFVDPPDEITNIPFTQKAAGVEALRRATPIPPANLRTLPAHELREHTQLSPPNFDDAPTVTMKGSPVSDEHTMESFPPQTAVPPTVEPRRVALIATADGDARVIALPPGASAPDGAAVALLFPVTKQDAARVAHLLSNRRRR
jgi:hypothetical protein